MESRYRRALRQPSVGARLRHAPRYSFGLLGKLSPEVTVGKTHAAERKALSLSLLEPRQVVRSQRTLFTQSRSGLTPRSRDPLRRPSGPACCARLCCSTQALPSTASGHLARTLSVTNTGASSSHEFRFDQSTYAIGALATACTAARPSMRHNPLCWPVRHTVGSCLAVFKHKAN